MKICKKCGKVFPNKTIIDGELKPLYCRAYCLECSPFVNKNIRKNINKKLTDIQEQILNGHLLGDGCLCKPKNDNTNSRFTIKRAASDLEYLNWSAKYFQDYLSPTGVYNIKIFDDRYKKYYYSSIFYTRQLPIFTEYYNKWYPKGKKIVPKDLILTPLTIAVWLADDGSIRSQSPTKLTMTFSTDSFSKENVIFLQEQLNKLYGPRIYVKNKYQKEDSFQIHITHTHTSKKIIRDICNIFPPLPRKSSVWKTSSIDLWDRNLITLPICIRCNSDNVIKHGWAHNKQRYYCKECEQEYMGINDYEKSPI